MWVTGEASLGGVPDSAVGESMASLEIDPGDPPLPALALRGVILQGVACVESLWHSGHAR